MLAMMLQASPSYGDTPMSTMDEMTASDNDEILGQESGETIWNKIKLSAIRAFVLLGNAATSTSLAANGANCSTSTHFAVGTDASGVAECEAIADADVPNTITVDLAAAATALAADPASCTTSTHFAVGINASGVPDCEAISDADVPDTITASNYAPLASPIFTGILTLPFAASPTTDADGEAAIDLDAWGSGYDALEIWNGTNSAYAVAIDAGDTCTNGQVAKFNTAGNWTCEDDGGSGAPSDADYLVGTANGGLSAEIVVGTSPGGELGGTWGTPTLDDNVTVTGWALGTIASGVGTALTALDGENIQDDTIDDDSIDFADVTLADITFDVGSVDTTEFGYLNGVTSAIQTQIDTKVTDGCTDCLNATEIEDIYLLNSGDTTTGTLTLSENTSIALDPAGSADGKYSGITIAGTSGYSQAFGDLVYLDPTDSRWEAVDANAAAAGDGDARGIIGMVVSTGTDGNACTILLQGVIRADAKFPSFTVNNPVYASETAAAVTQTMPTTTDNVIRVIGFALTADEIYFDPSADYITHI